MGKSYTLSWHNQGSAVKQAHNRREQSALGHNSAIDNSRTKNNVVLVDIPVRQAYADIFGGAVREYNSRARESRQIKDYWQTITADSRKHAAYEIVVQVGGMAEGAPDKAVDALKAYVQGWSTANPNLALVGAYIHMDESTQHLHLDYIPVAECSRGMKLQNTLTGALKAQGFVTSNSRNTAQMQWEQSERERMRSICREMEIDLLEQGNGRKYMSIPEYKQYANELSRLERQQAAEQAQLALVMQQQSRAMERTAEQQAKAKQWQQTASQAQEQARQWQVEEKQARQDYSAYSAKKHKLKEELDSISCALFSAKQDMQEQQDMNHDLQSETRRLQEEYKKATGGAFREQAIAILRADPVGEEWWAWAVNRAAMEWQDIDAELAQDLMEQELEPLPDLEL